ncbi:peptide-methionine (S)-S-oxide reductase MsrA [Sedimentibacter sp. MB31-C6]|uniref:peptide-methionine (S)-S-oxide reductase MsrA n=1 Tax=Sedimentibacter sp. MB31-C6 TaxID=3109366 RepID=UPI002DDD3487|nr:peptide-methionine (S)-S-oxide reductase MsrA [Sedimentibacter sp. MB36-C1]WSI05302.1 peptide-methionine (S)-S-oxide reductase MsrA [Sedimentibacter sp. MB36-C1]
MKEIYLAGGCFWGLQAYFDLKDGIKETIVGYANGSTDNPTYEQVCTNSTGYAETVYIKYNEEEVSLNKILEIFWKVIDPTIINRQGGDVGTQYRTGVYYIDDKDISIIKESFKIEQLKYDKPIVTELEKLKNFFPAEEYHQKYLEKNPNGYCHIDLTL